MENTVKTQADYNSKDMKLGFGFLQLDNLEPFQNFMKKILIDEDNKILMLIFKKFESSPMIIDYKNRKMIFPSKKEKPFSRFFSVTYEYSSEMRSVIIKTFSYINGNFQKGIRYINAENPKGFKLVNFLNIYSDNYLRTSRKLIENDEDYKMPVPDFYQILLTYKTETA
jgi:hypothetical protein